LIQGKNSKGKLIAVNGYRQSHRDIYIVAPTFLRNVNRIWPLSIERCWRSLLLTEFVDMWSRRVCVVRLG